MKSYKTLAKITLVAIYILIFAVFALMAVLPFAIQWYAEVKNRSSELATVVMLTCYPSSPLAIYALFSLRKLVSNIYKGNLFAAENFRCLRGTALCCFIAGIIMTIAGVFYMPFYIGAGAAYFCSLLGLVFTTILTAANQDNNEKENI